MLTLASAWPADKLSHIKEGYNYRRNSSVRRLKYTLWISFQRYSYEGHYYFKL